MVSFLSQKVTEIISDKSEKGYNRSKLNDLRLRNNLWKKKFIERKKELAHIKSLWINYKSSFENYIIRQKIEQRSVGLQNSLCSEMVSR